MPSQTDTRYLVSKQFEALTREMEEVDLDDIEEDEARDIGEKVIEARRAIKSSCYGGKKKRRKH